MILFSKPIRVLLLFCIVTIFINVPVFAQKDTTKSGDRINVFDRNSSSTPFTGYMNEKNGLKYNEIKINPFLIFNGDLPIYYERQVSPYMSVEGAIGMTFKNYMELGFNEAEIQTFPFLANSNNVWKNGYSLRISVKFYPNKGDIMDEGIYFSPEISYRSNNITYNYVNAYGQSTASAYVGRYSVLEAKILMGYVRDLFDSDNIMGESYFGVGLQNHTADYIDNLYGVGSSNVIRTYSSVKPYFYLGYKIGFRWK